MGSKGTQVWLYFINYSLEIYIYLHKDIGGSYHKCSFRVFMDSLRLKKMNYTFFVNRSRNTKFLRKPEGFFWIWPNLSILHAIRKVHIFRSVNFSQTCSKFAPSKDEKCDSNMLKRRKWYFQGYVFFPGVNPNKLCFFFVFSFFLPSLIVFYIRKLLLLWNS